MAGETEDMLGGETDTGVVGRGFLHETKTTAATMDWYTPPEVFAALGVTFDLDPCYPLGVTLPWIPARRTYTIADDGLKQPWEGLVWCNPPYGDATAAWLARMAHHRNGIALVFSRTDTGWFHDHVVPSDGVLFTRGRLSFIDGKTMKPKTGSGNGSILVGWGGGQPWMRYAERPHLGI